jgi:tetratricopeptide (TPR) repeat protein
MNRSSFRRSGKQWFHGSRLGVTLASSLAAVVFIVWSANADTVKLLPEYVEKGGAKQFTGAITSESATEVKIKPTVGKEEAIPVYKIDTVTYDGLPPSYLLAESRLNTGALVEAAELFQKAAGEAKGKVAIERAAQFNRALALTELALGDPAKAGDAAEALEAFVKAQPASRQIGLALSQLVRLRLMQGDVAKAEAAVNDLKAKVKLPADVAKEIDPVPVFQARIQAKRGEHEEAVKALDAILGATSKGSIKAREALLAKAESLAAIKKFPEAEAAVRTVIDQASPEDDLVQAVAYNTLGDCLRAAGRPKDALIAYLKTDILYDRARDQHARALAQIVDLWRTLKQDGRANEVQERLRQQYPQSPYAKPKSGR